MKKLIVAIAFGLASTAVHAQSAKVPTGIDVKGPTHYRLVPVLGGSARVVYQSQVCDRRAIQDRDTRCVFDAQSIAEANAGKK